jgi:hypothetical protein
MLLHTLGLSRFVRFDLNYQKLTFTVRNLHMQLLLDSVIPHAQK